MLAPFKCHTKFVCNVCMVSFYGRFFKELTDSKYTMNHWHKLLQKWQRAPLFRGWPYQFTLDCCGMMNTQLQLHILENSLITHVIYVSESGALERVHLRSRSSSVCITGSVG